MEAWLRHNPPARSQYRSPRRARLTGLVVVHTAENVMDTVDVDTGAEGVAQFIRRRDTPGSYHDLVDSDSNIKLVRYADEAYQDGTGSNPYALSISFACRTSNWATMPAAKRAGFLRQGAIAFLRQQKFLAENGYPTTPLIRVNREASTVGKAGFVTHGERDPGRRSDPGADFPWEEFFTAIRKERGETAPVSPAPTKPSLAPVPMTIAEGTDQEELVRYAQRLLIHNRHDLSQEGGVDGDFGPGMTREVRAFKKARGLPDDGVIGDAAWRRLIYG